MYKIAIADDDMDVSTSLGNYFPWHDNGFEVVAKLYDGKQTLDFLEKNNDVDVLISDICMPVMSGIELVRELRLRGRDIQVVLLSAYKDFNYAQAAMSYGVRHYLVKPATYSEIVEVLKKVKEELGTASGVRQAGSPRISSYNDKVISQIKTYIDQNCDTATLTGVAQLVHMNTSYLSRFFKENAGENISAYLTRVRMENALLLLKDTAQKNIYEIGERLGYANAKSFTKAFKAYYGITPQEYRRGFDG